MRLPRPVACLQMEAVLRVGLSHLVTIIDDTNMVEATTATVGVLRKESLDNSRVSRSIDTCSDLNHALLYTATMARDGGSNGTKRSQAPQSAAARWASGGDSPCAAQTPPPPTTPERPP